MPLSEKERITALETQITALTDGFKEMQHTITKEMPRIVKEGFRELREEIQKEHAEDIRKLEAIIKIHQDNFNRLNWYFFLFHKNKFLGGILILAFFIVVISNFRNPTFNTIFAMLGLPIHLE